VRACDGHTINKSVFGFLRQLTTRYCSHLLLSAVLLGALRPQLTTDIAYSPGARQQTRRTLPRRANGTERRTDGRTPYRYIHPAAYSAASDDVDKQMTIEFLGRRSSTVERPSTQTTATETYLRLLQTISENSFIWRPKRLVTVLHL